MAYEPCLNPSCKSHGKPHPNCKCYPEYANGGRVQRFCSKDRAHKPECQYFEHGGMALPAFEDTEPMPVSDELPPFEQTSPIEESLPAFEDTEPINKEKHGSLAQQALTFGEGAAQGATFGLSNKLETMTGLTTSQGIAERQEEHPFLHAAGNVTGTVGSAFIPFLEGNLLAKAGKAGAGFLNLGEAVGFGGKILSNMAKAAIETSGMQAGNEIGNALINKTDPLPAVAAHIAEAGAIGLLGGGIFGTMGMGLSKTASKLESIAANGIDKRVASFQLGMTAASQGEEAVSGITKALEKAGKNSDVDLKSFTNGVATFNTGLEKAISHSVNHATEAIGASSGLFGYTVAKALEKHIEKLIGAPITNTAKKYTMPVIMKILGEQGNMNGVLSAIKYAGKVASGINKINTGIDSIFKPGAAQLIDQQSSEKERSKVNKFISSGGINAEITQAVAGDSQTEPQEFADGGEVQDTKMRQPHDQTNPLATIFPEHNVLLSSTKGRVSNYLNSIRPINNEPKLPFDDAPSNKEKQRSYDKALDLAIHPLGILSKVKNGGLTPDDLGHFVKMYPELHDFLSRKMTEKIVQSQLDDEKPSYSKRQAISLFMGAPLEGTMTPQAIQTIQGTFALKKMAQQQQAQTKAKKGASSLSKASQSYQTSDQSRQQRSQKV